MAVRPALWMVVDLEEDELPLYVARNAQDVADYIGIAVTTIRRHRDEMPIYKENGAVIADKDAVDAWLADPPDWFAARKK